MVTRPRVYQHHPPPFRSHRHGTGVIAHPWLPSTTLDHPRPVRWQQMRDERVIDSSPTTFTHVATHTNRACRRLPTTTTTYDPSARNKGESDASSPTYVYSRPPPFRSHSHGTNTNRACCRLPTTTTTYDPSARNKGESDASSPTYVYSRPPRVITPTGTSHHHNRRMTCRLRPPPFQRTHTHHHSHWHLTSTSTYV
jgi:hypothetical protein